MFTRKLKLKMLKISMCGYDYEKILMSGANGGSTDDEWISAFIPAVAWIPSISLTNLNFNQQLID